MANVFPSSSSSLALPRTAARGVLGSAAWRVSPVVVLCVVASGLWSVFGVALRDMLVFLGYEAAFVAIPGWLAYAALTGVLRADLRRVAVGWALGYVLEIAWFAGTAAAGARGLFVVEPVIVAALAVPRLVGLDRHAALGVARRRLPAWAWALVVVTGLALVFVAEGFFSRTPLPWQVGRAYYNEDLVFPVAVAAEALHHWPLRTPDLAGTPLHYHYFANLDMAAVAQVTGLRLPLIAFRFVALPMVALVVVLLAQLAASVGRRAAAAVVAPLLVLFVTFFDPVSTQPHWPVFDFVHSTIVYQLYTSPPFLFGSVLVLALAVELVELLGRGAAGGRGSWVVVALLAAGCAGAKAPALPVVMVGVVLAGAYAVRFLRSAIRPLAIAGAISLYFWVLAWFWVYGANAHTSRVWPLWSARHEFGDITAYRGPVVLRAALWIAAGIVAILQATSVLLPLLAARSRRLRLPVAEVLLLGFFVAGVAICYLTRAFGNDQFFFLFFGYLLGGPLAAVALVELWDRFVPAFRMSPALVLAGGALALALVVFDTPWRSPHQIARSRSGADVQYPQGSDASYLEVPSALYRGLTWVRDHTLRDAVLAINNLYLDEAGTVARACYYTAFTERRAMLECEYGVTPPSDAHVYPPSSIYPPLALAVLQPASHPFADRFRIERAIFERADPGATHLAAVRYGVHYLLVDLVHHGSPAMVARLEHVARLVFRNSALAVLEVRRA